MAFASPVLLDRLAALLGPKGFTADPGAMAPWLTDWRGRFHGVAAAMLSPAGREEVAGIVRLCAAEGVPLVPQGGNTSMVGGATPDGSGAALVVSLRRMNRIRELDAEAGLAVCDAGVVLADLHETARAAGRRFPLSLAAKGSATIGGLVSTNAGGTQVLRFGTMRGLVQGIEAVLPDGSLYDGLTALKKDNRGYDLRQLLIGAEGTLGIVTAASLRLVPAIGARAVAWIGLGTPDTAMRLLRHLDAALGDAVESFELVPRLSLDLVLAHVPGTRDPLDAPHPWYALVEAVAPMGAPGPEPLLYEALRAAFETGLASDATIAASEAQAEALWRLRENIAEGEKAAGPAAKHDISVAIADMPRFVTEGARTVEARFPGTRVNAFGHLGDGNIHFNVMAPAGAAPAWLEAEAPAVSALVHDLVTAAGGSISAEHGIGQMKLAEFARLGGDARLNALRAIKRALDPGGIMNPGKLVPLA
ncbi:FAD-binding oxidoreductase [Sphingosinicella sp. LHD-64]|uniref:FAD-binding oxidoreductase n=1 Tax=Sphingosinicella sp. LHD-64 TaxID=3072139 RepID=UPI00280FA7CA|nr:FAD-binding oxidoreductase [Sphingosinicella sp. LHD-64]MDQ8755925.1 FAD-binding oxidoreductase [Sphingosinicella sp. LHD-64]